MGYSGKSFVEMKFVQFAKRRPLRAFGILVVGFSLILFVGHHIRVYMDYMDWPPGGPPVKLDGTDHIAFSFVRQAPGARPIVTLRASWGDGAYRLANSLAQGAGALDPNPDSCSTLEGYARAGCLTGKRLIS